MIQLYFLSIVCNSLSGYVLFSGDEGEAAVNPLSFMNNPLFHLVLGIISAVTGILKLLSPSIGGVLILGDLVPSAAGLISGFMLIFGIYRKNSSSASPSEGSLDLYGINLLRFRRPIGLGLIAVAIIHFLFPQALFL
jgi:hypothetical protein